MWTRKEALLEKRVVREAIPTSTRGEAGSEARGGVAKNCLTADESFYSIRGRRERRKGSFDLQKRPTLARRVAGGKVMRDSSLK